MQRRGVYPAFRSAREKFQEIQETEAPICHHSTDYRPVPSRLVIGDLQRGMSSINSQYIPMDKAIRVGYSLYREREKKLHD